MTRKQQIKNLLDFLRKPPFRVTCVLDDGKIWIRHAGNLESEDRERLTAWLGCNFDGIIRYLSGDSRLEAEPAFLRLNEQRMSNGCFENCINFSECLCKRPCNDETLCVWCSGNTRDFPCGVLWGKEYESDKVTGYRSDKELLKDFTVSGGCSPKLLERLVERMEPKQEKQEIREIKEPNYSRWKRTVHGGTRVVGKKTEQVRLMPKIMPVVDYEDDGFSFESDV